MLACESRSLHYLCLLNLHMDVRMYAFHGSPALELPMGISQESVSMGWINGELGRHETRQPTTSLPPSLPSHLQKLSRCPVFCIILARTWEFAGT